MTFQTICSGVAGMLNGPPEVERFRTELQVWSGVEECFLVSSGKAALTLALEALKELQPGRDEVLIPAYTCYSVPSAIIRAGLRVKVCDIDPETLDFDVRWLEGKLANPRLLAVIPCHLYGRPANLPQLRSLLKDPVVAVIEDAAQAFGNRQDGRLLGTSGDIGVFSLGRGKALSTVSGGILLIGRREVAANVRRKLLSVPTVRVSGQLKLLGYALALMLLQRPALFWLPKLLPWLRLGETIFDTTFKVERFSPFQAGLTRDWLARLERLKLVRRKIAEQLLEVVDGPRQAQLRPVAGQTCDWVRLPVIVDTAEERSRLLSFGSAHGLGLAAAYPDAVSAIPALGTGLSPSDSRNARWLAGHLVTVPVHPYVGRRDLRRIKAALRACRSFSGAAEPATGKRQADTCASVRRFLWSRREET